MVVTKDAMGGETSRRLILFSRLIPGIEGWFDGKNGLNLDNVILPLMIYGCLESLETLIGFRVDKSASSVRAKSNQVAY